MSGQVLAIAQYKKFIKWGILIMLVSVGMAACQAVKQFGIEKKQFGINKTTPKPVPVKVASAPVIVAPVPARVSAASSVAVLHPDGSEQSQTVEPEKTPFDGMTLHVSGYVESSLGARRLYMFTLAQNGQGVAQLTMDQVQKTGYTVTPVSSCVAKLQYGENAPFFARCDAPQIYLAPATVTQKSSM